MGRNGHPEHFEENMNNKTPFPTVFLLPCPFCGSDARNDAHADDCYFTLYKGLQNAPEADLSMVPDVLSAWNRRAAIEANTPAVPDVQDVANLLSRFEHQWHRMGELWERCQGKGWPDKEGAEFNALRDEKAPTTREALLAVLAAPQPQPVAQPVQTGWTKALEIRTEQGWELTGKAVPVLYTDTINGEQVSRDDVWLCTTAALAKSQPVQAQPRQLTIRELADVTAPWSNVWTDQSFGIANAAIAKFCEVNYVREWADYWRKRALISEARFTKAATDVLAERHRQISVEGWEPEHDDEHDDRSLAIAAACYALRSEVETTRTETIDVSGGRGDTPVWKPEKFDIPPHWPESWSGRWWKPSTERKDLVKAGALILAEIERLDRAQPKPANQQKE